MGSQIYIGSHLSQSQSTLRRVDLGKWAEELVCKKLKEKRFVIKGRNLYCPLGEADILAWDAKRYLIIEVRCKNWLLGQKLEKYALLQSVLSKKKLIALRALYNYFLPSYSPLRIDFAAVVILSQNSSPCVFYFKNIFRHFE